MVVPRDHQPILKRVALEPIRRAALRRSRRAPANESLERACLVFHCVLRKQPDCLVQFVVESCSQAVGAPVQAEVLLQPQFELATQAVADLNVVHDVGVPLHTAPELH